MNAAIAGHKTAYFGKPREWAAFPAHSHLRPIRRCQERSKKCATASIPWIAAVRTDARLDRSAHRFAPLSPRSGEETGSPRAGNARTDPCDHGLPGMLQQARASPSICGPIQTKVAESPPSLNRSPSICMSQWVKRTFGRIAGGIRETIFGSRPVNPFASGTRFGKWGLKCFLVEPNRSLMLSLVITVLAVLLSAGAGLVIHFARSAVSGYEGEFGFCDEAAPEENAS